MRSSITLTWTLALTACAATTSPHMYGDCSSAETAFVVSTRSLPPDAAEKGRKAFESALAAAGYRQSEKSSAWFESTQPTEAVKYLIFFNHADAGYFSIRVFGDCAEDRIRQRDAYVVSLEPRIEDAVQAFTKGELTVLKVIQFSG